MQQLKYKKNNIEWDFLLQKIVVISTDGFLTTDSTRIIQHEDLGEYINFVFTIILGFFSRVSSEKYNLASFKVLGNLFSLRYYQNVERMVSSLG